MNDDIVIPFPQGPQDPPKKVTPNTKDRDPDDVHGLTSMQRLAVDAYANNGFKSLTNALLEAGYSKSYAKSRQKAFRTNKRVIAAIQDAKKEAFEKAGIEPVGILKKVLEIAEDAQSTGDYGNALRAYEMLGKNFAMWSDKTVVKTENPFAPGNSDEDRQRNLDRLLGVIPKQDLIKKEN